MTLIKFEPWKEFEQISERMKRFFEDVPALFSNEMSSSFAPKMDISEDDKNLYVHAELAGLKKDDVKISIQDDILTIKGEKKLEQKDEKKNYYRIERCFGSFSRSFALPVEVDVDKVTADFKDGLLTITLPKVEQKPVTQKLIEIK